MFSLSYEEFSVLDNLQETGGHWWIHANLHPLPDVRHCCENAGIPSLNHGWCDWSHFRGMGRWQRLDKGLLKGRRWRIEEVLRIQKALATASHTAFS